MRVCISRSYPDRRFRVPGTADDSVASRHHGNPNEMPLLSANARSQDQL